MRIFQGWLNQIFLGNGWLQCQIVPSVSQLRESVQQQLHMHVDESPWPVLGLKEWLWVVASLEFCLFHTGDTWSRAELEQQLGSKFDGVLSTDDFSVYNGYPVTAQQKCLAHLRAAFQEGGQVRTRQ